MQYPKAGVILVIEGYSMRSQQSHEGPKSLSFSSILMTLAVPAGMAAIIGFAVGAHFSQVDENIVEMQRMHHVNAESRTVAQSAWSTLGLLGDQTRQLGQARTLMQLPGVLVQSPVLPVPHGKILHWAEFEIQQNQILGVKQSVKNPSYTGPLFQGLQKNSFLISASEESAYLQWVVKSLNLRQLLENGMTLARLPSSEETRSSPRLAIGFPGLARSPAQTIMVILVDPAEVFSFIGRFAAGAPEATERAYLVGADGVVLAHSQPSYVGADFSQVPLFKNSVQQAFAPGSGKKGISNKSISVSRTDFAVDQLAVTAAYQRLGSLPLVVVTEEANSRPNVPARAIARAMWLQLLGEGSMGAGFLCLLLLVMSLFFHRKLKRYAVQSKSTNLPSSGLSRSGPSPQASGANLRRAREDIYDRLINQATGEPLGRSQNHAGATASKSSAYGLPDSGLVLSGEADVHLRKEILSYQEALKTHQAQDETLSRFEQAAIRLKDPKRVADQLVKTAHEICKSPSLFFGFFERSQAAILQSDAGFAPGESPLGMSFPIHPELLSKIFESARRGEVASLSGYSPLSEILIPRLGVACFDAWAVTGYGHLGRQSVKPRLLGIFVIVQAGVESAARHDSLCRMIRTTGLVYENALLTQSALR